MPRRGAQPQAWGLSFELQSVSPSHPRYLRASAFPPRNNNSTYLSRVQLLGVKPSAQHGVWHMLKAQKHVMIFIVLMNTL